jgi:hypothetical protein
LITVAMSRKHYQETAAIISAERAVWDHTPQVQTALREVAGELAAMFKRDNSRFDRSKFMEAAGFGEGN